MLNGGQAPFYASGFTLALLGGFSIGDVSNLLGDGSKKGMVYYWEEVKAIHCDEIETLSNSGNTAITYHCSLVMSGPNKRFTVQCATPDDLNHLVSALEFWVRNAQAGKNAPVSGMLYLNQGLLMKDDGQVTALWVDGPAEKSGLLLSDYVWGLDQDADNRTDRNKLEKGLRNLKPGKHFLYVVSPADKSQAEEQALSDTNGNFNPKRARRVLTVP